MVSMKAALGWEGYLGSSSDPHPSWPCDSGKIPFPSLGSPNKMRQWDQSLLAIQTVLNGPATLASPGSLLAI